jgi:hypothetical protein
MIHETLIDRREGFIAPRHWLGNLRGEDRTNKLHFCPRGGGQECRIMGSYVNISGGGSAWPGAGRPGLGSDLSFSRQSIACGVSKW